MMPDFQTLFLFLLLILGRGAVGGDYARPGHLLVAARTLAGGRAEAVASSCGTGLGGIVHTLAGGLGVSTILLASAELVTVLKLIGAAYLVWVGLRTFRSARRDALTVLRAGSAAPPVGSRRAFREGVLVEALNPKTAAFFLAFIPQFVDPTEGHVALQFVVLGFLLLRRTRLARALRMSREKLRGSKRHETDRNFGNWRHAGAGVGGRNAAGVRARFHRHSRVLA